MPASLQDVGVDHDRGQIVMPEPWLNGADAGAAGEMVHWVRRQTSERLVVKLRDGVQIALASWRLDALAVESTSRRTGPSRAS